MQAPAKLLSLHKDIEHDMSVLPSIKEKEKEKVVTNGKEKVTWFLDMIPADVSLADMQSWCLIP